MKKTLIIFLLSFVLFHGCKKANGEAEAALQPPGDLKTKTFSFVSYSYFYNEAGFLERTEIQSNIAFPTATSDETYTYNANKRMIKSQSSAFTNDYVYDSNNRIQKHFRTDKFGKKDSVTFIHRNDSVIGSWGNVRYYYFDNQLANIINPDFNLKIAYTYNNSTDLSAVSLLRSYDVLTLADFSNYASVTYFSKFEITGYTENKLIYVNGRDRLPYTFKRTYSLSNQPIRMDTKDYVGDDVVVFDYTYY